MDEHARRVARSLLRIDGSGSFSASHREIALGLAIEVADVGRCSLPLDASQIERLIEHATPSPFGYQDQTLHDESVRSSWEIPGSDVTLDPKTWTARFERGLGEIREALAFPEHAEVSATLSKLVIYETGQFFKPHRDSEKQPDMAATLVVVLPSDYEGGQVIVAHAGKQVTYDTSDATKHLSFLGFYADCLHEVRPVHAGHRVALTFNLSVASSTSVTPAANGDLESSVRAFFERPKAPQKMIVLLDHQYSQQSLDWTRLKAADRVRADALRSVADAANCDCYLALADVRELYQTHEEHGSPGTVPPGGYGDLLGEEVSLDHWIDGDGEPCAGTTPFEPRCEYGDTGSLVSTVDSHSRTAYHLAHEPWTGNEGGTADVWYYQSALILVRRATALHDEVCQQRSER